MKARALFLLFALFGAESLLAQNLVTPPERREETLDALARVLAVEPPAWPATDVARISPFVPPSTVVATTTIAAVAPVVEEKPPPTEAELLIEAARRFRPTGAIISSRRRLLQFADGQMVREGERFDLIVDGERYEVLLEAVSIDDYTLRLGSKRLHRRFADTQLDPDTAIETVPTGS